VPEHIPAAIQTGFYRSCVRIFDFGDFVAIDSHHFVQINGRAVFFRKPPHSVKNQKAIGFHIFITIETGCIVGDILYGACLLVISRFAPLCAQAVFPYKLHSLKYPADKAALVFGDTFPADPGIAIHFLDEIVRVIEIAGQPACEMD
jgi:hypothetical protein